MSGPDPSKKDPPGEDAEDDEDADPAERRVLKVRLPVDLHLRLHRLKIEEGRSISDVIQAALLDYLRRHPK